ncbi:MAG: RDD family protein [Mycobacterium sp.]
MTRNAGIVSRGSAGVIDLLVVSVALAAIYVVWVLVRLGFSPRAFSFPAPSVVFSTIGFFLTATVYLAGCWAVSGRTVGAVIMGIRVVDRGEGRLKSVVAVLRALACVVFPIGLAWAAIDRQRRSAQDILLGTRVVYDRALES